MNVYGIEIITTQGSWKFGAQPVSVILDCSKMCIHLLLRYLSDSERLLSIYDNLFDHKISKSETNPTEDLDTPKITLLMESIKSEVTTGKYWIEVYIDCSSTMTIEQSKKTTEQLQKEYEELKDKLIDKYHNTGVLPNNPLQYNLCIHLGRLNSIYQSFCCEKYYKLHVESFKGEKLRSMYQIELTNYDQTWTPEYQADNEEAVENFQYWFEKLPLDCKDPCVNLDLTMHPRERYQLIKDKLDEDKVVR